MIAVLHSELLRTLMIRSSWVSIALTIAAGLTFSVFSGDFWILFAGLGAFGLAATTTAQHYQHRTAVLLFLGRPGRWRTLTAQCVAAAVITTVTAALSGLTLGDSSSIFGRTLLIVPLVAVFGVAVATVVRRPTWLLLGAMAWLLFIEGLVGRLKDPLPFTAYLTAASTGHTKPLVTFLIWLAASLVAAGWSINRDLTGD